MAKIRPEQLDQDGASDGEALVWSNANQVWQPGSAGGTSGSLKYRWVLWAEENGGLSNNNNQYSYGNGATGVIGLPMLDAGEIVGMVYNADAAGDATTEVEVRVNDASVSQSIVPGNGNENAVTTFTTAVAFSAGDMIGFRTLVGGGASDVRVGAVLEFEYDITAFEGPTGPAGPAGADGADGGQTDTVAGSNGITNTGDNVDAVLAPTYGTVVNTICQGNDSRLSDARTPTSHASTHASGGGDALKLDDLAAPDDNTDLDATTSAHGLLPKLGGGTTNFLRADGTWNAPAGGGGTDADAIHVNVAAEISGITEKTTPVSADLLVIEDSADSNNKKRVQVGNLPGGTGGTSPLTTKGDLYGYDTADARIPIGTNGQVLIADSAQALGLKWGAIALGDSPSFDGYMASSSGSIAGGLAVPLDTEREKSSEFTHSTVTSNSEVTISTAGVYLVSAEVSTQLTGGSRSSSLMWLELDTGSGFAEVDGTRSLMYNREASEGGTHAGATAVLDLSAGDKLRIWTTRDSGSAAMFLLADTCRLVIVGMHGPAGADGADGADGATGATGSGSNIIVQDGGVTVGTVMDTVNFGTGLTVTNDGSGDCTVDAAGGGGPEEYTAWQDTEDSTSSTTFQDALTLTFTPDNAGEDWLIEWSAECEVDDSTERGFVRLNVDSGTIYTRSAKYELSGSDIQTFSGMIQLSALSAASHTITVQYAPNNSWTTMRCRDIFIRARSLG